MAKPSLTNTAKGKLVVYVLDQDGKPIEDNVVVLVLEHKSQFADQIRQDGTGLEPIAIELDEGLYSVQAAAANHDVSRTLVRILPGEAFELRLLLPSAEYKPLPLEARLEKYGINLRRVSYQPLVLEEKQHVVLDYKRFYDKRSFVILKPETIDDLKRWIGTPDEVFGHGEPRYGSIRKPEVLGEGKRSPEDEQALAAIAREYIHGNSKSVGEYAPYLNTLLKERVDAIVSVFFFNDVTINQGARLEIGKNSNVFAVDTLNIHRQGTLAVVGDVKADIGVYRVFG